MFKPASNSSHLIWLKTKTVSIIGAPYGANLRFFSDLAWLAVSVAGFPDSPVLTRDTQDLKYSKITFQFYLNFDRPAI